jgi:hypothetical protein
MLILPGRFSRQPQQHVDIDWSNPITRGLVSALVPSYQNPQIDIVSRLADPSTNARASVGTGTFGRRLFNNGALTWDCYFQATNLRWPVPIVPYQAVSVFTLYEQYDTASAGPIWGGGYTSSFKAFLYKASDGSVYFYANTNTAGLGGIAGPVLETNRVYALAGVNGIDNTRELFVDGQSVAFADSALSTSPFNSGFTWVGTDGFGAGEQRRIGLYCAYVWTRKLTSNEIKSLTDNPWQIFEPQRKRISLPPPVVTLGPVGIINPTKKYSEQPQTVTNLSPSWPWRVAINFSNLRNLGLARNAQPSLGPGATLSPSSLKSAVLGVNGLNAYVITGFGETSLNYSGVVVFIPRTTNTELAIFNTRSGFGSGFYVSINSTGKVTLTRKASSGLSCISTNSVKYNEVNYLAFSFDGTTSPYPSKIVLNGVLTDTTNPTWSGTFSYSSGVGQILGRATDATTTDNAIDISAFLLSIQAQPDNLILSEWARNPWALFNKQTNPTFLPPPATTVPTAVPYLRTKENTTNLEYLPQVNTQGLLYRDLYNVIVFGRLAPFLVTSVKSDNSQFGYQAPGNSAAWPALFRDYDSKYGTFHKLPTGSGDSVRNIPTFNTFLGSKGATLLLTAKFSSSTSAIGSSNLFKVGSDFTAGLAIDFQHTGTELQTRSWAYKGAQRASSWVTLPTDKIIQIVLTSDPTTGEKLYIDGALVVSQTAFTGQNTNYFIGATMLGLFYPGIYQSTNVPKPQYYFAASWGRPLNDSEVSILSKNPLQLLKPKRQLRILTPARPYETPKAIFPIRNKYATSQPQSPVTINWNNPITRGLISAVVPGYRYPLVDAVTKATALQNSASIFVRNGAKGRQVFHNGSVNWTIRFDSTYTKASYPAITVFNLFEQYDTSSYGTIYGSGFTTSAFARFYKNSDGSIGFYPNTNTAGAGINSPILDLNRVYALTGVSVNNSTRELFIDGQMVASSTTAVDNSFYTQVTWVGSVDGTGAWRRIGLYCGYVWTRRLTPVEIKSLSDNPWQIFNAKPSLIGTEPPQVPIVVSKRSPFFFFFN